MDRIDRHRLGRDADHGRSGRDVLGHDRVGADLRALANLDRAQHLRSGTDDDARADGRMALAGGPGRRIGAAQGDMLIDGDIVADFGALADHAEAVIEKEALSDPGARVDVDRGQEAREMVDQPREEIEVSLPQPVADPMQAHRPDARIEHDVPARAGGGIAGFDEVEISDQAGLQDSENPLPLPRQFKCGRRQIPDDGVRHCPACSCRTPYAWAHRIFQRGKSPHFHASRSFPIAESRDPLRL